MSMKTSLTSCVFFRMEMTNVEVPQVIEAAKRINTINQEKAPNPNLTEGFSKQLGRLRSEKNFA